MEKTGKFCSVVYVSIVHCAMFPHNKGHYRVMIVEQINNRRPLRINQFIASPKESATMCNMHKQQLAANAGLAVENVHPQTLRVLIVNL